MEIFQGVVQILRNALEEGGVSSFDTLQIKFFRFSNKICNEEERRGQNGLFLVLRTIRTTPNRNQSFIKIIVYVIFKRKLKKINDAPPYLVQKIL